MRSIARLTVLSVALVCGMRLMVEGCSYAAAVPLGIFIGIIESDLFKDSK